MLVFCIRSQAFLCKTLACTFSSIRYQIWILTSQNEIWTLEKYVLSTSQMQIRSGVLWRACTKFCPWFPTGTSPANQFRQHLLGQPRRSSLSYANSTRVGPHQESVFTTSPTFSQSLSSNQFAIWTSCILAFFWDSGTSAQTPRHSWTFSVLCRCVLHQGKPHFPWFIRIHVSLHMSDEHQREIRVLMFIF